ncbi:hypothetical protein RIR_v02003556800 [Rhizophagus irregularis DAOM 181602=DAOM 197198]|nr:hypothetical protein RIR_v02003556800 [Rhizophagus irregularis DAOM 181602=DAOM 197198]CAB5102504.1 unnamed protein product [Rhizophagus irregularis]
MRKWRSVLFSDESTFIQFQQGHQEKVWHEPGEILNPDCIAVTVQLQVKPMLKLFKIMSYQLWISIFHVVMEFSKRIDNALPYHSKVAMATHKDAKIVVLQWPAQSLDLNPI